MLQRFLKNVPQRAKKYFRGQTGTILKPQKRQNIDILIVIVTTYLASE